MFTSPEVLIVSVKDTALLICVFREFVPFGCETEPSLSVGVVVGLCSEPSALLSPALKSVRFRHTIPSIH